MSSTFTGSGDLMFFLPESRMETSRGWAVQPWVAMESVIVVVVEMVWRKEEWMALWWVGVDEEGTIGEGGGQ